MQGLQGIQDFAESDDADMLRLMGFAYGTYRITTASGVQEVVVSNPKVTKVSDKNFKNATLVSGKNTGSYTKVSGSNNAVSVAGQVEKASGVTGTVWDEIKGTQPPSEGTTIPKSFEINVNGEKLWVNPNGTKHMVEYSTRNLSHGQKLTEQQLLRSFQGAVEQATSTGIKFDTKIIIDNWELIFSPAREAGQLPVIKHAVYLP
ncbi:hypothetical protein IGI42_001597 [Enterococcus sp. AZ109]